MSDVICEIHGHQLHVSAIAADVVENAPNPMAMLGSMTIAAPQRMTNWPAQPRVIPKAPTAIPASREACLKQQRRLCQERHTGHSLPGSLPLTGRTRTAWIFATVFLILSAAIIVFGTLTNITLSNQNDTVYAYHNEAQGLRIDAVEQLLEEFEPTNQIDADKTLAEANQDDNAADNLTSGDTSTELTSEISVGIGSAPFGAILGWMINLYLAEVRSKKDLIAVKKQADEARAILRSTP